MPKTIATNTRVELNELLDFVRPRHRMILVTRRRDGSPQLSPVTGGVDEQGRIVISTYPERAKVTNLRRDPAYSGDGAVATSGTAPGCRSTGRPRCSTCPRRSIPLVDYFRAISGEHPDWDEYRQAMRDQGKSLVRVTPTRWGPIATGGFPARLAGG